MNLGRLAISLPAPGLDARACVEIARRAEREWGYDAIWLAETNGPESFALAGALAMATERATIGTAIVPVYNRTPAVLAMSAATAQQLSGGRFVLGLGSSSHAIIDDWNGIPFEKPLTHVRESVAIVRQALAGEKTGFSGTALRSHGFRLGNRPQQPVPIYLGALREKMLRLAGEVGDGLIVNLFPVTALPKMLAAYREGARTRNPTQSASSKRGPASAQRGGAERSPSSKRGPASAQRGEAERSPSSERGPASAQRGEAPQAPVLRRAQRGEAERSPSRRARVSNPDEVVCRFQVLVTDDVSAARNLVRLAFGGYVAAPVYNKFFAWCGFEDEARAVADAFARRDRAGVAAAMTDAMVDQIAILGSAEACREQLAGFVAAGVTTPVLSPLAADRAAIESVFATFAPG